MLTKCILTLQMTPNKYMTQLLSIVIPVYFNEDSLSELFNRLDKVEMQLLTRNVKIEIIAVDDGSKDSSFEKLLEIKKSRANLKVIQLVRNFGEATASKIGLKHSSGDSFTVLAADLQDPPELIIDMVDLWLNDEPYIICERQKRQDPIASKIFAKLYYQLLTRFIMPGYPKKGFDLFLMDSKFLPAITDSSKSANIPLLLSWIGLKPAKISYNRELRKHGKSKWSLIKKINLLLDVLFSFSRRPIRFVSFIGILVALFGLIYGLTVVFERLNGFTGSQGTASIIALVSFSSGLILVTLGIIAEYIWRIWDEVNKRPNGVENQIIK